MLNPPCNLPVSSRGDRLAIKPNSQVVAHRLHALVILAFEPGENSVARKIVSPTFERGRHLDAQLRRFMENRRTGIRSENVGPELRSGEFLADVHHEVDGFASFLRAFSWKPEDDVERRDYSGPDAALRRLVNIFENLEILVHQLHHRRRSGFDPLADLLEPRTSQQSQLIDTETGRKIGSGLNSPIERSASPDQPPHDLQ